MFTFGQIPTCFEVNVTDDKRALTLTFSDLQVNVGGSNSPAPMSTRMFSLVLPLEGGENDEKGEERVEIEFIVQGSILSLEGATATLVCSVNGRTTVTDFPGASEQGFVQKLKFEAEAPSEARLCVFLLLGRDSKNANTEAHMNVSTIDVEILPRPR